MAITKLVSPNTSVPVVEGDWALAMAQVTALKTIMSGNQMVLTQWTNTTTLPKLANGAYIHHLGAVYKVDTEDFTIAAPAADGTYYIRLVDDGADSLDVDFVTDISGYSWNPAYNGMYNSTYQVLPYQISVSGTVTVFTKRKILNFHRSTGFLTVDYLGNIITATILGTAIVCNTVDTGQGANELYGMDQGVKTTDSPSFVAVSAGSGAFTSATVDSLPPTLFGGYTNAGTLSTGYTISAMKLGEIRAYTVGFTSSAYLIGTPTSPADSRYFVMCKFIDGGVTTYKNDLLAESTAISFSGADAVYVLIIRIL